MKVQGTSIDSALMTDYTYTKANNDEQKVWNQVDTEETSVQVTISEQGLDSYRKSLEGIEGNSTQTYDEVQKNIKSLKDISSKNIVFGLTETLYGELISANRETKSHEEDDEGSFKNQVYKSAHNYLESYANKYNEIVKGYEDGTRELWIEDENSELGFRKVTKEEELDALDKAYERIAEFEEACAINEPIAKESKLYSSQQLAQIRGERFDDTAYQKEEPVERIYERMMNCRDAFKNRYSMVSTQGEGNQNISSLIDEIFRSQFMG